MQICSYTSSDIVISLVISHFLPLVTEKPENTGYERDTCHNHHVYTRKKLLCNVKCLVPKPCLFCLVIMNVLL